MVWSAILEKLWRAKMEKIGSYVQQSGFYDRTAQTGKDSARTSGAKNADAAKENKTGTTLSAAAQKLLKELKKTYSNMDFIVADYETDEEAAQYLSRGKNEYSALLSTDELEKMAADEDVKKKNMDILDNAVSKLDDMKAKLGDKADDVTRIGIAIGEGGEVSFFAELEKNSEKQRERIEKQREDKSAAAKETRRADREEQAQKLLHLDQPAGKRTTVYASTVEELAEKIGQVDWNAVKEARQEPVGQRFDLTI